MSNKFYYMFTVLLVSISLSACFKKTKQENIGLQCNRLIQEALSLHKSHGKTLERTTHEKITNLIKAAKIDQQHNEFAACTDKASRAISLIGVKQTAK